MEMERQEWLEKRRAGIGGSDCAAMLGLSKYRSPYQLYLDKRGELPETEDNEAMFWGRELEPVIRKRYEREMNCTVITDEGILQHRDYPFMLANLDGRISDDLILEIKTARYDDGWGEVGTAEIPISYSLQCQWYLCITGAKSADVAVLISGSDYRLYRVEKDLELQTMLIDAAIEFWQRVQDGNPPEVITYDDAVERYGKSVSAGDVFATEEVYDACEAIKKIKRTVKTLEEMENINKAIICKYMSDNYDTVLSPEGKAIVTWKLSKGRSGFDSKTFKAAYPLLYEQFNTTGEPSRKLLIK